MIDINEKSVSIDCDGSVNKISTNNCKRYRFADAARSSINDNLGLGETAIQVTVGKIHEDILGDGHWDFTNPSPHMTLIFIVRTLFQGDPRAIMEDFTQAMRWKLRGFAIAR